MNECVKTVSLRNLRSAMIGMGMIFDDTYRPFFENVRRRPLADRDFGMCQVELVGVGSRTGSRAEKYLRARPEGMPEFANCAGPDAVQQLLRQDLDAVCVATPDDRHFEICREVLRAGKHLLVEKPAVLSLQQLDELTHLAAQHRVLAKIVYHKLFDPDHKKLRTLVRDGMLHHVNHGYCVLLEPKFIAFDQFKEWIAGRNPGTYVAVHYIKLIDYTFGGRLSSIQCTGQRGLVGAADGNTWDSTQLRLVYHYDSGREAAFDIHTSWVTPDNFPGYVEQEVQFRFDDGVWIGHSRRRGVECTIEDKTPMDFKSSLNNHYSTSFVEPWNERTQRGYGVEAIERFFHEVATVEYAGPAAERDARLEAVGDLHYNALDADRQVVAALQGMEAILEERAAGNDDCVVRVNGSDGGLVLYHPGTTNNRVLYGPQV